MKIRFQEMKYRFSEQTAQAGEFLDAQPLINDEEIARHSDESYLPAIDDTGNILI